MSLAGFAVLTTAVVAAVADQPGPAAHGQVGDLDRQPVPMVAPGTETMASPGASPTRPATSSPAHTDGLGDIAGGAVSPDAGTSGRPEPPPQGSTPAADTTPDSERPPEAPSTDHPSSEYPADDPGAPEDEPTGGASAEPPAEQPDPEPTPSGQPSHPDVPDPSPTTTPRPPIVVPTPRPTVTPRPPEEPERPSKPEPPDDDGSLICLDVLGLQICL